MNLHRDRFVAGAAFFVRAEFRPGGKSFRVFDRTIRWRCVARNMRAAGSSNGAIAAALKRRRAAVDRALAFARWYI